VTSAATTAINIRLRIVETSDPRKPVHFDEDRTELFTGRGF